MLSKARLGFIGSRRIARARLACAANDSMATGKIIKLDL